MPIVNRIAEFHPEIREWRRDLHAHPELMFDVHRTAKTVARSGRAIELTAHEFSILEVLALRADRVVTRSMIWDRIYDYAAEPSSNVIEVFIGNLRKKLERDGLPRLIHTRRGLGYVLRKPL